MPTYVVLKGKKPGIYSSWEKCKNYVLGYKGAKYKKFENEIDASKFYENNTSSQKQTSLEDFFNLSSTSIDYYVYTDGSCINNGKPSARAGIGIFFGDNDTRNVSKKVCGKQTNNVAELLAVIGVYEKIKEDIKRKKIGIVTDSKYVLNCVGNYGKKCESNNWSHDIPNKVLVKQIYDLYKNEKNVYFIHIYSHTGKQDKHSIGNEKADKLANLSILN